MGEAVSRSRSAPVCSSCKESRGIVVMMDGPSPDPSSRTGGKVFVCPRCDHTMLDRRRATRQVPDAR
jgi:predicted RNA-binding Zn-ribbon protein involved in translation (DUF1610 family)